MNRKLLDFAAHSSQKMAMPQPKLKVQVKTPIGNRLAPFGTTLSPNRNHLEPNSNHMTPNAAHPKPIGTHTVSNDSEALPIDTDSSPISNIQQSQGVQGNPVEKSNGFNTGPTADRLPVAVRKPPATPQQATPSLL